MYLRVEWCSCGALDDVSARDQTQIHLNASLLDSGRRSVRSIDGQIMRGSCTES